MQNVDEMIIKTDVIELIQKKSMERSLQSRKTEVHGECYVSKNNKRKKKINEAKKVVITVAALAVVSLGTVTAGAMDFTNSVREEVNSTYVEQNLIGGQYETKNTYDEGFVDYANDLNDFELYNLYNKTENTMPADEKNDMEKVVDEMEENYLESKGGRGAK